MPKLAQILKRSCGSRQVCVSVFFFSDHCIKQIDSMLPWVCSVIDHRGSQNVTSQRTSQRTSPHRGRQNVVKTKVTHSPPARVPLRVQRSAFLRNSLFLDRFSRDFWLSNKPCKSFRKNRRLGDFFWRLTAFMCYYYYHYYRTMVAHTNGAVLPFSWEKILQNDAKNKVICENAFAL